MAISAEAELLERELELAELEELLAAARTGSGRLLLVEAAAGLGKTRLLREARRRADLARMRVLTARATELERDFPFGVVRQLFEPPLADADQVVRAGLFDGPAAAARPLLEPELSSEPEWADGGSGDPSFATLHGLYWFVANLVDCGPALVAVDDAHWADSASLGFLAFLLPRLEDLPVLLLLALRPEEPDAAGGLARLRSDPVGRRWSLAPLSAEAVAQLVQATLGSDAQPAFCSTCHEVSGGNPFLLGELTAALEHDGVAGRASDAPLVRELGLEGVARATLLRLARLPPAAASLARAAAVLGDSADGRHVAALSGLGQHELDEAADALGRAGILEARLPHWGLRSNLVIPAASQPARALAALGEPDAARERAEAELANTRRWGTPGAIGTALATRGVVEGGDRGAELLREAVGLLERSPARLEHARALTDLGAMLRRAGHRRDAREPLRAGFELARRCGALPLAKRAHSELGATGEKLPRFVAIGVESLTPSERRIAEMAAKGLTNRQIAQELFLTVKTIETHLHAAYDKLDIRSRRELPEALGPEQRDEPADR